MQFVFDLTLIGIVVSILAAIMAGYLIYLWFRQENRLLTDLPLLFGIVFIAHAANQIILLLSENGVLPMTLEIFRVRAMIVGGIALPLVGVLLHIWLPRLRKYHIRIIAVVTIYWIIALVLGPTQEIIMLLHMPVIIIFMGGMVVTFAITWKTGRLKEIRSDLMVISAALSLVGQASMVSLAAIGLAFVPATITGIATVLATLALINPWFKVESRVEQRSVEIYD
ncbi:MAG: hypothetical protein RTV31_02385 [Candidatus Thorarchaeota archaeon]